jgi:hypothetical protein
MVRTRSSLDGPIGTAGVRTVRSGSDWSDLTERGRRRGGRRRSVSAAARHRSWAKSLLRGSNRTGLGSVTISVTRVIHLRHLWASGCLGLRARRRKRVCAVELAGVRRSSYGNGLRSTTSSAKGPGERADAHRGLELADETAQGGRRRGPSGEDGRRSRRKPMQGPPCFWSPWIDSWRSCEDPTGVREVRGSPAAINFGRDRAHRQWRSWRNSTARAS